MNFKRALLRIGQELGQRDVEDLKFGCRDVIPESRREKIHNAREIFTALEEKGLLSSDKLDFITRLLADIGRPQLLSHLEAFGFSVPELSSLSPTEADSTSESSPFTRCLLLIAQKLTNEELDKLTFAWCGNYLMMTPDKIYSANQLFDLMNQRLIIKPNNLQVLYIELNEMGRQDLCKIIEEYYHSAGIVQPNNYVFSNGSPTPPLYREDTSHSGYPHSSQELYYPTRQNRPNELIFASSPSGSSLSDLNSQMSHLRLTTNISPPQAGPLRKTSTGSNPENFPHGPIQIFMDQHSTRPSSAASGSNDGSPYIMQHNTSSNSLTQQYDGDWDQQSSLLAQKELELENLKTQLSQERALREQDLAGAVRTHEVQVLQEALQLKNKEVNELRTEMSVLRTTNSSVPQQIAMGDLYSMDCQPHGVCLIINNYEFFQGDSNYDQLTNRSGANKDQESLSDTFQYLNYQVELHENLTSEKMVDVLKEISCRDHSNYDSFVCCILTHGEEGVVFGADSKPVNLRDLTGIMKGTFTRTLMNKPKLFFVQACRGDREERGIPVEKDGDTSLPVEADFLFGYATPTGKAAYRSRRHGSWFISELCQVFQRDSLHMPLGAMMKKVNRRVSDAYTKEGYKQCTEVVDRLRKDVLFFPVKRN